MTYDLPPDLVDNYDWGILGRIPECLRSELAKEKGPKLCYTGFMVGTRAGALGMANCKDAQCGVAWVRLVGFAPSTVFPTVDEPGAQRCNAPLAYEFEIGIGRCAPRAAKGNMYPDEQDMFAANRLYMADAQVMRKTVLCCIVDKIKADLGVDVVVAFGGWTPLEEGNGLAGGVVQGFIGRVPA